jgi:hypothetical protein
MIAGQLDTHFLEGFFQRVPPSSKPHEDLAKLVMQQKKPTPALKPANPAWRIDR